MSTPDLSIIILTYNEEKHLERCIKSLLPLTDSIIIVDSFSNDKTIDIAKALNVRVFQNKFENHASQLNWALQNIPINSKWLMRVDADEVATLELCNEIKDTLLIVPEDVSGYFINIYVRFLGRVIRYGGHYPIRLIRLWRNGSVKITARMMDEKFILIYGRSLNLKHSLIDENLSTLTDWTAKHNRYSNWEAAELLNQRHHLSDEWNLEESNIDRRQKAKKWFKSSFFNHLPLFFRVMGYFIYRYFIRLGFLDGYPGLIWHFLQGFWYRFLIDAKVYQIEHRAKETNRSISQVLAEDYHIYF